MATNPLPDPLPNAITASAAAHAARFDLSGRAMPHDGGTIRLPAVDLAAYRRAKHAR